MAAPTGQIIGVFVRSATAYGGTENRKRVSVTRTVNTVHPAPVRKSMRTVRGWADDACF
jgi:hypothetical protein